MAARSKASRTPRMKSCSREGARASWRSSPLPTRASEKAFSQSGVRVMIGRVPSSARCCQQSWRPRRVRTCSTREVTEAVCGAASPRPSRMVGRSRIDTRSRSSDCSTRCTVVEETTVGMMSSTSFFCSAGSSFSSFCISA